MGNCDYLPTLWVVVPNGLRYPLVGGIRQCHFDGTSLKPRKLPENAANPTSRVHAMLACFVFLSEHCLIFFCFFSVANFFIARRNFTINKI